MNDVDELDFTLELNSDTLPAETEGALFGEAESRLLELAEGHDDMRGAAINIRRAAHGETPHLYEVTVVVYARPKQIAATEKKATPHEGLNDALEAVERQIREKREKLGRPWERPGKGPIDQEVTAVDAVEGADGGLDIPDVEPEE
jgi:ribosome-associated translation inhibitor RaiA